MAGPWEAYQTDKKPSLKEREAAADVGKKEADASVAQQLAALELQREQREAAKAEDEAREREKEIEGESKQQKSRKAEIRVALAAVQRVRELAEERLAIGSASEFLQNVPLLNQNRRNIETAIRNAEGGILADIMKELAEINKGGVTGQLNTEAEARRRIAQIADLNPNQDLSSLLAQAKLAEDYYLRQAAGVEGKDTVDQDLLATYLPESRLLELAATDTGATQLSEDGTTRVDIPDWYQQSHFRYLNENRENLDPSQYAAFRADLDERAGFTPDLPQYVRFGEDAKEFMRKGGTPQQMGLVPPVTRRTSALEQGVTDFAASPGGAATMSAIASATAGIPVALAGGQEKMEAVRQNQPVASFVGDVIGGALGAKGLGTATRFAGFGDNIVGNPVLQDAAFNVVSGATQAEDPLQGASAGLVTSLIGEYGGRTLGRMMPDTFASRSMQEARESVPTSGELGREADALYRQAQAQGQKIAPGNVDNFIDDTEKLLRSNGFIDQGGDILGTGPVQDAFKLLRSFRGKKITPAEAKTIREKFAEGRMAMRDGAPDNKARAFSGELTNTFDNFAEATNALPGIAAAREVAQRRIVGRELERARELGQARGDINYSQGGEDLGIRRAFGNLDTAEVRGAKMYPPEVEEAIRVVSRGTPARDVAQFFGRFSPQGGNRGTGLGLGVLGGYAAGDPVLGGILAGLTYGTGAAGRKLASAGTRRDAELAELIARGGPASQSMLDSAAEEASLRAGRLGAGAFGAAGIRPFMDEDFREETPTSIALEDLSVKYPEQPPKAVPPAEEGFTNVTAAGGEVAPAEATGPQGGDTIMIENREAVYDPTAKAYIFTDTQKIARRMQRGGAVRGYQGGGSVGETAFQKRQRERAERQAAASRRVQQQMEAERQQKLAANQRNIERAQAEGRGRTVSRSDGRVGSGRGMSEEAVNRIVIQMLEGGKDAADIRAYLNALEPGLGGKASYLEDGVADVRDLGYAPRAAIKFTSPREDAMMAVGRRGADFLGMGADFADMVAQYTPIDGGYRDALNRGMANLERDFTYRGGVGAYDAGADTPPPSSLTSATSRLDAIPSAAMTEIPRGMNALMDYARGTSPREFASDIGRGATSLYESALEDPYGLTADALVYSNPITGYPAAAADFSAARAEAAELGEYALSAADPAEREYFLEAQRVADTMSPLALIGAPISRRVPRAIKTPTRRKRGGLAVKKRKR